MATFLFCCYAHAQVDLSAAAALSPAAPAARPLITSVPRKLGRGFRLDPDTSV